jgi:hypothetical protein
MDFCVKLEKAAFEVIRQDLRHNPVYKSCFETSLKQIDAFDFVAALFKAIERDNEFGVEMLKPIKIIRELCYIFDMVDVDSNGFVEWSDFTNFVLRAGRFTFTRNIRNLSMTYCLVSVNTKTALPLRALYHIPQLNRLMFWDCDTPNLGMYRHRFDLFAKFNPNKILLRNIRARASVRPTMSKREQSALDKKARAPTPTFTPSKDRGSILCMTYIPKRREMVFCTSDNFVSCFTYMEDTHYDTPFSDSYFQIIKYIYAHEAVVSCSS